MTIARPRISSRPGVSPRRRRTKSRHTYLAGSGWAALYQQRAWSRSLTDLPDWAGIVLLVVLAVAVAVLLWLGVTTNWRTLLLDVATASTAPPVLPVATWPPLPAVLPTPLAQVQQPAPAQPVVVNNYYVVQPDGRTVQVSAPPAGQIAPAVRSTAPVAPVYYAAGAAGGPANVPPARPSRDYTQGPGPGDKVMVDLPGLTVWEAAPEPARRDYKQGPGPGDQVLCDCCGLQVWEPGW